MITHTVRPSMAHQGLLVALVVMVALVLALVAASRDIPRATTAEPHAAQPAPLGAPWAP